MLRSRSPVTKASVAGALSVALVCCGYGPASGAAGPSGNALAAPAAPNVIANGNFALSPPLGPDGSAYIYDPAVYKANKLPVKTIPGWLVGSSGGASGGGVQVHTGIQAPVGSAQCVVLGWGPPGSVTQTVKTVAGATYLLSWYGAGFPLEGKTPPNTLHVLWDASVVAAPTYNGSFHTSSAPGWKLQHQVVTATSASSTVEFADATNPPSENPSMVGEVSLSGDAKLYLPPTPTIAPTGKLLAVVRTATGAPLVDPSLVVNLYGTYTETQYAPPVTQLMASGPVLSGQVTLQLHLHAAMAAHTIPAYATLSGPGFTPVTDHLKIKVS